MYGETPQGWLVECWAKFFVHGENLNYVTLLPYLVFFLKGRTSAASIAHKTSRPNNMWRLVEP